MYFKLLIYDLPKHNADFQMLISCTEALTVTGFTFLKESSIKSTLFFPKQEWAVPKGVSEPNLKKKKQNHPQNPKQTLPDALYMQEVVFFLSEDLLPSL